MNPVNATFGHIYHVSSSHANMLQPDKDSPAHKISRQVLRTTLKGSMSERDLAGGLVTHKAPVSSSTDLEMDELKKRVKINSEAHTCFLESFNQIKGGQYTLIKVGRLKQLLGDAINKILKPNQLKDDNDALIFVDIPHTTQGTHLGHTPFKDVKMTDDDAVKIAAEQTIAEWTETLKQPIQTILD